MFVMSLPIHFSILCTAASYSNISAATTCVDCPLGTYAASQYSGGVSMALACQVNKKRVTVMVKFMHNDLNVIWFSNFIIYWVDFRLVPLVHTPL